MQTAKNLHIWACIRSIEFDGKYNRKRYSYSAQDGVSTAFIPSGADSAELILIATGIAIDSGEGLLATQLDSPSNADEEGGTQYYEN